VLHIGVPSAPSNISEVLADLSMTRIPFTYSAPHVAAGGQKQIAIVLLLPVM
jgi:hypothetical protein